MTRLTPNEQYSLMTLFTIFKSPLMFGGDLPSNDDFTLSLLTNEEVLKMHRESTGVKQLFQDENKVAITSKNPDTGEIYLALFNISDGEEPLNVGVELSELGIDAECYAINMWTGEDLGKFSESISKNLSAHESILLKLKQ
jgi:hypothetical protein